MNCPCGCGGACGCGVGGVASSVARFGDAVVRGAKKAVDTADKPWQLACRAIPDALRARAAAFLFSSPYTLILDVTPYLGTIVLPLRILLACGVSGTIQAFARDALDDLNAIRDRRGLKGALFSLPVTSDAADFMARYDGPLRAVLEPVARGEAPSFVALAQAAQIALGFLDDEDRLAMTAELADLAGIDPATLRTLSKSELGRRVERAAAQMVAQPTTTKKGSTKARKTGRPPKQSAQRRRAARKQNAAAARRAAQRGQRLTPEQIAAAAAAEQGEQSSALPWVIGGLAVAGTAWALSGGRK